MARIRKQYKMLSNLDDEEVDEYMDSLTERERFEAMDGDSGPSDYKWTYRLLRLTAHILLFITFAHPAHYLLNWVNKQQGRR